MTKVLAHLADVKHLQVKNPCNEISLPVLLEPKTITLLRLQGVEVFDYTESLGMAPEIVDKNVVRTYLTISERK